MGIIGSVLIGIIGSTIALVILILVALEAQYRQRPGNDLELTAGKWEFDLYEPQRYLLVGNLEFLNRTRRLEVMVPEIRTKVTLLSSGSLDGVTTTTRGHSSQTPKQNREAMTTGRGKLSKSAEKPRSRSRSTYRDKT